VHAVRARILPWLLTTPVSVINSVQHASSAIARRAAGGEPRASTGPQP
jgi:hypothetical protein